MTSFALRSLAPGILAVAAVFGHAHAGARAQLEAFTRGLSGLDGQFSQEVFDEAGRRRETAEGRVALSAPRLLRWETITPYPQLIVADGTTVWVYDPDLQQATRRPQGAAAEADGPLLALTDPARLEREYRIEEAAARDGLEWLLISPGDPAGESGFQQAMLGFDHSGLVQMEIVDMLGQRTRMNFSQWQRNPTFAADTFRFVVPEGVDVVGGD